MAVATAVVIAVIGTAGIVRSSDLSARTALWAKVVGGSALLLVPILRWRSIRRAIGTIVQHRIPTRRLPLSFRTKRGRHLGLSGIVGRAVPIEFGLLLGALVVAIVLMRQ